MQNQSFHNFRVIATKQLKSVILYEDNTKSNKTTNNSTNYNEKSIQKKKKLRTSEGRRRGRLTEAAIEIGFLDEGIEAYGAWIELALPPRRRRCHPSLIPSSECLEFIAKGRERLWFYFF